VDHRPPRGSYRGRRRVPTPPRSRYAAVVTTAFVGAGVVALGTSHALPDLKSQAGYSAFDPSASGGGGGSLADPQRTLADRAARGTDRGTTVATSGQSAADYWQLPLRSYTVTSPFGQRWGVLHPGVDLAVPEGTPYYAAAPGTVILCRWNGGYGYNVMIDHGNGIVSVYGHSSKLLCHEGQQVKAGDLLGLTGNTGYSYGPHLHFEIRVEDRPTDPIPFMREHGVDVYKHVEVVNGGVLTG
jgi:murein DD-endopeptidase MepM/ murein hydrolase activator NlpD